MKYIELKSRYSDNGPAWIAKVTKSKTGRPIYFNGRALKRKKGSGIAGNYFDLESGEEYWISGVKKKGRDRHQAGSGKVLIEASGVAEYLSIIGATKLDPVKYEIFEQAEQTDVSRLLKIENAKLR